MSSDLTKMEDLALTDSPDTVSNDSNDSNDRNMTDKSNNIDTNIKEEDVTITDCKHNNDDQSYSNTFTCTKCTLINTNNDTFQCEMCGQVRTDIDVLNIIHQQTWQTLIDLNEDTAKQIPQWIACTKCRNWRIIKVQLSSILTWESEPNYTCEDCTAPPFTPSTSDYPYFELQTMTIQRALTMMKHDGFTQKAYKELTTKMEEISQKMKENKLNKQSTIIIDADDEETENESEPIKEESKSWICHQCTFENTHLGNLCAMCDTPKQDSFASKMTDAEYAKSLHESFKANSPSPELTQTSLVKEVGTNQGKTVHGLPADAQIGPFGSITCLKGGVRFYLVRRNTANKFASLDWSKTPPKFKQSWVETVFPKSIYLPKMDESELKFIQNNIDLTQDQNDKSDSLFHSNVKPKYVDFDERSRKYKNNSRPFNLYGDSEDVMPFDFVFKGMNGSDDEKNEEHKHLGDTVEEELGSLMNRALKQDDIEPLSVDPKGMNITLFAHQKKGVAWMNHMENERTNGGFLCDQMGVGKTIQIIALMLKSRQDAIAEKERRYKEENGYLTSSDDEGTESDSQDEKCGGFVVSDDEPMDFRSDDNERNNDLDSGDEEWKPEKVEKSRKRKRKYDDLSSDDLSEDLCANRPLSKKKKKRRKLNNGKSPKSPSKSTENNPVYEKWHNKNFGKKQIFSVKERTLIIGPLAIIDQWADEIKNRAPNQFNVAVYHGAGRKKKFDKYKLKKYDVVITTYGHVSSEFAKGNEEKQSGLFRLRQGFFHRIVLDEAHTIKNSNSWQSKACAAIGNRGVNVRWALTGTPIQNEVLDLFALSRFLQIPHSAKKSDFKKRLKISGGKRTNVSGRTKQAITAFLAAHMLRRLKSEVVDDLVSKTEEVIEMKMDDAESAVYEAFQNHARTRFNKFVKAGTAKKNYAHILVLLLRLRQITDHPYLAMKIQDGQSESIGEDGDGNDKKLENESDSDDECEDVMSKVDKAVIKRLNEMSDSILDSECPICLDIFSDGVMFRSCGHLICSDHLYDLNEQCMLCRKPFKADKVIKFADIIKSDLVNEIHKKSMLADGGQNGLIMDGEVIANKMQNVDASDNYMLQRKVIWRKVTRAKGIFRSNEQIKIDETNASKPKVKESTDEKLKKLAKKFDWRTYSVEDELFKCEFEDDDEEGYKECDKYPNEEWGWKFIPSSKTKMVIQKVRSIRKHSPNDKIIIFSQFTTMLGVMERVMNKYGINYLMYDGSKTRQQRKEIISAFKADKDDNDIPVILMSLKCAALGLNLTVANHVIFCDLWWNPATESQAIDRVHRIGQTKHVYITRIVIKDSVEERILDLQRKKQNIADSALDGANFAKQNKLSIADLGRLFGADQQIIDMAEDGNSGFNRDSLMNNRRRPSNMVQINHRHNNNSHNHNHHQHVDRSYVNSLDAGTLRLLQEMGEIPRA